MALTDKLIAIGNAIRAKTGKTDTLTLDEMPTEIASLSVSEAIKHAEIPDYVKEEALEVANKVRSVQTDDSIVFIAMSDSHHYGEQGTSGVDGYIDANGTQTNVSNLHGAMAAKVLAFALDVDFMAHLGDAAWGHKTTTSDLLNSQIDSFFDLIEESHANLPCFHAIGNHDTGLSYHNQMISDGNTGVYTESGEHLYNTFTALSDSDDTVFGDVTYGGYCYRDFNDKKLRVFLLNTSEHHVYNQVDGGPLGSQRLWFANSLLDLNNKTDASGWKFIVLSHYPADFGGTMPLSELLKAYVEGSDITISIEDGTSSVVSFSNKNSAKMIAQFHGHVHNFKTSKLHSYETGSCVQYNAWRMCVPNGQYDRENYYTTVGSYKDIDFSEDTNYSKTIDTANDTSFVVNVINPSEQLVYSFCYGAGYDRVISYLGDVYYTVSKELNGVSLSNNAVAIKENDSYVTTLLCNEGYVLHNVKVTMGGQDVTSQVYNDGLINITNVTGNINITAYVIVEGNLVPYSIDVDGSIYNDVGYLDGSRVHSSGEIVKTNNLSTVTGFIPFKIRSSVKIVGGDWNVESGVCRIAVYDASMSLLQALSIGNLTSGVFGTSTYNSDTLEFNWDFNSATAAPTHGTWEDTAYIRISCQANGKDLVVYITPNYTEVLTHPITNRLTDITSNNAATYVENEVSYTATLTANDNCTIGNVTVYMGGVDVTSVYYSNGVVNIPSVTGAVVITGSAETKTPDTQTYINQLHISTDTDGTIYNGLGYKANTYLSSGVASNRDGVYTSGFIPVKHGDVIYFKNCTIQAEQSNHRFMFYDANKTFLTSRAHNTTSAQLGALTTPVYGSDGNMIQLNIDSNYWVDAGYIRFCCSYIGEDSIVTVNEPIE